MALNERSLSRNRNVNVRVRKSTKSVTIRLQRSNETRRPSLRLVGDRQVAHKPKASVHEAAPSHALSKRCFDFCLALFIIILFAPGLLAIALAIKATSPGPILFRQKRYGLGGKTFTIFKFRTMRVEQSDRTGVRQTRRNDPRVTTLGRLLRRSSLDELPQLFNILRGDMSLVGPRPHVPDMLAAGILYEELVPYYFDRCRVRPGMTGLAQVNGLRGSTEDAAVAKSRIDHDLDYIEQWSFWLDARILISTAKAEFLSGSGI